MEERWHRFEDVKYASMSYTVNGDYETFGEGTIKVEHREYPVLKTTAKGVWLNTCIGRRFVRRDAKRQFASPTVEQAKEKFINRKQRQLSILRARVRDVEKALEQVT